jgi:hypothetical protein
VGEDPRIWTWSVLSVTTRQDLHMLKTPRLQRIQNIRFRPLRPPYETIWRHPEDLLELFKAIQATPSIKNIFGIETYELRSLKPTLLASVLSKLDFLKLSHFIFIGKLSMTQLEHIYTTIAEKETPMKDLTVCGLWAAELRPSLFASLLLQIVKNKRPLAELNLLMWIDEIDPVLVGKALIRLEKVTVSKCNEKSRWISHDQITAILRGVMEAESKIKTLLLKDMTIDYLKGVDRQLLKQATQKIGKFIQKSSFTYS